MSLLICVSCLRRIENSVPIIKHRIIDNAELFSEHQKDSIFDLIKALDLNLGPEIGLVTIDSLDGKRIEEFSLKMANELQLGRINFKDGLLLCYSKKEGLIRIEIGRGLEKVVSEDNARLINRVDILPMCKVGKYFQGFYAGISRLKKLIEENKKRIGQFDK